jgi:hypothetical protein
MHPSRRCVSASFYVPVARTRLLYKEVRGLPCRPWSEELAALPALFRLRPGATTRNLAAGECGVCW